MDAKGKVWVALDLPTVEANLEVAGAIASHDTVYGYKVNSACDELMYRRDGGVHMLESLADLGNDVWIDLKFHDVPPTVARRVRVHVNAGLAQYATVMAKGEVDMMIAAVKVANSSSGKFSIIAVTELTSNSEEQVHLGSGQPAKASVINLARNAVLSGVEYLVCSTKELQVIVDRKELEVLTPFVPGISLGGIVGEGQSRVGTLTNLFETCPRAKAVIGSGIIKAADPLEAVNKATAEIEAIPEAA